jgi:hypothetical protein
MLTMILFLLGVYLSFFDETHLQRIAEIVIYTFEVSKK